MKNNLGGLFLHAAKTDAARVSFWDIKNRLRQLTYRELAGRASQVARALQARNVKKGDRIAIVLPTHEDFYAAFFGVILVGGIPAALYPPVRLGKIEEWKKRTADCLKSISCKAILTDLKLFGILGTPAREAHPPLGVFAVESLIRGSIPGIRQIDDSRDDIAFIQFSSGSTGHPKPVALSHKNVISNAWAILNRLPGDYRKHSGVSWLPLYHDMGLIGCVMTAMIAQSNLTLIRPEHFIAHPRIWLEALTKTKATVTVAPNFAYGLCTDKINEQDLLNLDLSHLQVALCGAETVHPDTLNNFKKKFSPVGLNPKALTPVYGLSESTLAVTFSPIDKEPTLTSFDSERLHRFGEARGRKGGTLIASLGQPLEGIEIEIRDGKGAILPPAKVGEIWIKGDNIMKGYWDLPQETEAVLRDGWLNSGDLGFIYSGDLYLCGRSKDIIIVRGKNFDPFLIEQSFDFIEGIRKGCSAAFSTSDEKNGTEKIIVLAEYYKEKLITNAFIRNEAELKQAIKEAIRNSYQLTASEIYLIPPGSLPRTSSGKIRRRHAKRLWEQGRLEAPTKGGSKALLWESLRGLYNHLQLVRMGRIET